MRPRHSSAQRNGFIRPRPVGQGKHGDSAESATDIEGFNPPPARWPGETPERRRADVEFQSAPGPLARGKRAGRAARQCPCFNPPPARWPGETPRAAVADGRLFQSAPGPLAGGETNGQIPRWPPTLSVSIRPRPVGQGKPDAVGPTSRHPAVSIRPRPVGQGKPNRSAVASSVKLSIRPRPVGQGKRDPRALEAGISFNPPPARWPGETSWTRSLLQIADATKFQSAPGPLARGNPR